MASTWPCATWRASCGRWRSRARGAPPNAWSCAAQTGAAAAADLQARMDEMRDNKEGWIAYALAGETEPGENVQ
jgi:hypothetical protein